MSGVLEAVASTSGMSYAAYVIAAYAVFLLVLAWDGVMPWLRHRNLVRQIRLKSRRKTSQQTPHE